MLRWLKWITLYPRSVAPRYTRSSYLASNLPFPQKFAILLSLNLNISLLILDVLSSFFTSWRHWLKFVIIELVFRVTAANIKDPIGPWVLIYWLSEACFVEERQQVDEWFRLFRLKVCVSQRVLIIFIKYFIRTESSNLMPALVFKNWIILRACFMFSNFLIVRQIFFIKFQTTELLLWE